MDKFCICKAQNQGHFKPVLSACRCLFSGVNVGKSVTTSCFLAIAAGLSQMALTGVRSYVLILWGGGEGGA